MSFSNEERSRYRDRDRDRDRDSDRNRERDSDSDERRGMDTERGRGTDSKISKRDNKHDIPIINTTTLKINVKTTDDLTTKEYDLIPFHPNMADVIDVTKNKNYILFPSFVKITMKDLKESGIGSDYQQAFLDLDKYIRVIKYVTSPDKLDDPTLIIDKSDIKNYTISLGQNALSSFVKESNTDMITIQKDEPLTNDEIIINNIGIIKNLFFPSKGRFYILGNEYIIGESKYIPPYIPSSETNTLLEKVDSHNHNIPLFYTITIELQLLDAINNPGVGDFGRMSCKAKKASIAKDAQEVFGTNFGYVEEKKATVPSILNTSEVSKERNLGKLQLEWEQRNKFQREPTTERERLEMERNMTPLQKKMVELERKQKELGEVPPLWEKETNELEMKKENFEKRIKELQEEYKVVTEDNKDGAPTFLNDLQNSIKDKMYDEVIALGYISTTSDNDVTNIKEKLITDSSPLTNSVIANFIKGEETKIDNKHVEPFLTTNNKIKSDVETLETQANNIKEEIKRLNESSDPSDKYKVTSLQDKLLKYQADIRKKKAIIIENDKKYGKNGEEIIKGWKKILKDKEALTNSVNNEKKKEGTRLKREIVDKELDEKFKKIKELNKELLVAYFYEGQLKNLTKRETEEYDREKRPDENVSDIISNLKSLEEDYLETASKVNESEKTQAFLKLYSDYLNRLRKLKDGKEDEKKKVDYKLKDIARTLRDLKSRGNSDKLKSQGDSDSGTQYTLQKKEENDLITKITDINTSLQTIKENVDNVVKNITELKGKQVSIQDLKNKIDEYQDLKYTEQPLKISGGRKYKHKRKSKRLHLSNKKLKYRYKTRRMMENKNKNKSNKNKSKRRRITIRHLNNKNKNKNKNRNRKKKYTIRRRRN